MADSVFHCLPLFLLPLDGRVYFYFGGRVVGGVYDNRLFVKPTLSAKALMPNAEYQLPYGGAKAMQLIEGIENSDSLKELFEAIYEELPEPKKRK